LAAKAIAFQEPLSIGKASARPYVGPDLRSESGFIRWKLGEIAREGSTEQ
jgi:hypothetical protein